MKRILPLMAACILSGASSFAASRFWIGSSNVNWNNSANWAVESSGAPGASVPGIGDDVIFDKDATVLLDGLVSINSLTVQLMNNVTIYTNVPVSLTISGSLYLAPGSMLKDSTSQPVAFPVIFNPATSATASIQGHWTFAGNNPANLNAEDGAYFIATTTNRVKVLSTTFAGVEGRIISRQFAGNIVAADSALEFADGTYFLVDGDLNPTIPNAKWANNSNISINGNIASVTHGGAHPFYGSMLLNLATLTSDANLNLPDGSEIKGVLNVSNTNGHTLTILSPTGPANRVQSIVRNSFNLSGASTNVTMATATAAAPQTTYQLGVGLDFIQTGGNFSLQDFNGVTGSSTFIIGRDLREVAGTFITHSTATGAASFVVDMDFNYGGSLKSNIEQVIRMASGTIDNAQNMVTLRLDSKTDYTGATLQSPLSTGKIDLFGGPITTTATNILTINNPDTAAIKMGVKNSCVNGPVRITTNSTRIYTLPTGKMTLTMLPAFIVPTSSAPSMYQAEYFRNGYSDRTTISAPLSGIAQDKYWNITKISGADAKVQLKLTGPVDGAGTNDVLVVAHYANSQWVGEQGSVLRGDSTSGTLISRNLTSYGAFTFGYINFGLGSLPVKLVSFDAVKLNTGASINWRAEEIPARFDVQRSTDGKNFMTITSVTGIATKSTYNYFDESLPQGYVYYRLQSIEKDGSSSYSKIATIINKESNASLMSMTPTIVNSQAKVFVTNSKAGRFDLVVTDMQGRSVTQVQVGATTGSSETILNLSSLKSGVYQVTGLLNGVPVSVIRFVKN